MRLKSLWASDHRLKVIKSILSMRMFGTGPLQLAQLLQPFLYFDFKFSEIFLIKNLLPASVIAESWQDCLQ